MAISEATGNITLVAAEALTVHRFVFIDSSGEAAETNDETQVDGVCMETVAIGVGAPIMTKRGAIVPVLVDGAHAAGARVSAGAGGEVVTASVVGGEFTVGVMVTASLADQDIVEMVFDPQMIDA